MINLKILDETKAKEYYGELETQCILNEKNSVFMNPEEIRKQMNIKKGDKFLLVHFKGSFESFKEEFNFVRMPWIYTNVVVLLRVSKYLKAEELEKLYSVVSDCLGNQGESLSISYILTDREEILGEVELILKVW